MSVPELAERGPENGFYADHVRLLRDSLRRWTGRTLIDPMIADDDCGYWLFEAPFAVLSHGAGADPTFTYGNRQALRVFETSWRELLSLPSRLSAEPDERSMRAELLERVSKYGCIEHYSGVRISRTGRRFLIERATVWNLLDAFGGHVGQAAMFQHWRPMVRRASSATAHEAVTMSSSEATPCSAAPDVPGLWTDRSSAI